MFEVLKYEKKRHTTPPAAPATAYEPHRDIEQMSFLFWGEHCVECTAPSCYSTCELYQKRPDHRCRRLTYGMYKNRNFPSLRGYGAEMSFKRWAQLTTRGNTRLQPLGKVVRREKLISYAAPVLDSLGSLLGRITGDIRWHYISFALLERFCRRLNRQNGSGKAAPPDAFLLEVYNPTEKTIQMQLAMRPAKRRPEDPLCLTPSLVRTVSFAPGYSRYEVERTAFQALTDAHPYFDISLTPQADEEARLVFLTADFVIYAKKEGAARKDIKCVVWDLDNTLWEGILVENDEVRLRSGLRELLQHLDSRGILLSVVSKNDEVSAMGKLQELGLSECFLYPQINWMPKSQNIKTIAERLNIGLDTFAFVDDNPFELEEVSHALPTVTCIHVGEMARLRQDARFQGSDSAEAKQRRWFYREAITREHKQSEFADDYLGFLAYCEIKLDVHPYREEDLTRVSELVQRTNQLNFSGRKYTGEQLAEVLRNPELDKYVLKCSDRYGDYGTVGFSLVRPLAEELRVEDFMLSCRVQGKMIEQAFFAHLQEHHNSGQAARLTINFQETARNKPAQQVLQQLHFRQNGAGNGLWLDLNTPICSRPLLQVRCKSSKEAPVEITPA